ncbi:hypothetical protein L873DRAFT_1820867 [Choiromyces venosus 120613-1]|uniref:F-box domain-containing protein n=1 Tax=Choiromyces venosus 120613-1 TaxID=1336337 RepID=A0A3N4J9Q9_9PEZI|nr:hypothetical protein L873DRAFT_1820867 [Choiromyces venosus 120613-1]
MSVQLPLHLALLLVPYLDPSDIARARRVCKSWYPVFSSSTLAQAALRIHYPLCYEVRTPSCPIDSTVFNRVGKRYAALKSGLPQQEFRIPITKTRRNDCVWTFAENLIVAQIRHHPAIQLALVYLDTSGDTRRIRNGRVTINAKGETSVAVKVCRDVLAVERAEERATNPGRSNWVAVVNFFRLSLEGEDTITATDISTINTFEYSYIDYSHQVASDHSGKYYAAYSRAEATRSGGMLCIWDIETSEMVRRVPSASLAGIVMITDVVVVAKHGLEGQQHVVVAGNDKRNNNANRWGRFPGEWGYLSNFKVFPIEDDSKEAEWNGFVGRTKAAAPRESNILASTFKVPRFPHTISPIDAFDTPGYESEDVGLALWELEDGTGQAASYYHQLSPGTHPKLTTDASLTADLEYRLLEGVSASGLPTPFTVKGRAGLSFTMDFTGRNGDFEGTRLMLYQLRIQGFYPSDMPGVMERDWESCLKIGDAAGKPRGFYSANRNVSYTNMFPAMKVIEDEMAVAFLELTRDGMSIVVANWDEPYEGRVLNGTVL